MATDDLKKRIEALNRKPLRNVPDQAPEEDPEIKALRRKLAKRAAKPAAPAPAPSAPLEPIVQSRAITRSPSSVMQTEPGPVVKLEEAIDGVVVEAPQGPGYYLIEQPAADLDREARHIHTRFVSLTGHPDGEAVQRIACACRLERIHPEEVLFLDLETTGLSTTPVFLVGTMECTDCGFVFRQYFARDYSEEISIVSAISERMKSMHMLVTFNGKTFDEPFLRNRAVATGVRYHPPKTHLDVLHEARRCYRRDLPNCRLQTLEQMVCGRCREDDIPGSEIPAAYHEYVRSGNAHKIQQILHHNLWDLLTMADLMNRMWCRE